MKSYSYYKPIIFQGLYLYLQCINDSAVMLNQKGGIKGLIWCTVQTTNNNALGFVYLNFGRAEKH
jgi:hypothetical protein